MYTSLPRLAVVPLLFALSSSPLLALDLDTIVAQIEESDAVTQMTAHTRLASDQDRLLASARAGGAGLEKAQVKPVAVDQLAPQDALPDPHLSDISNPEQPLRTEVADDPLARVQRLLGEAGLAQGPQRINGQEVFVAIGYAPVSISPGTPGYVTARDIAFQTADLLARKEMAEYMAVTLTQQRSLRAGHEQRTPPADTVEQAAQAFAEDVGDEDLDQELADLGVEPEDVAEQTPAEKRVVLSRELTQTITRTASERIQGAAVIATSEGPLDGQQQVVVALISSHASAVLANLATSSPAYAQRQIPTDSRQQALARLPLDNPLQMAGYFGAQMLNDGDGNYYVVAVGQAEYATPEERVFARENATMNADAALLTLLTEQIDSESQMQKRQLMEELADGEQAVAQVQSLRLEISGRSALQLRGITTVREMTVNIDGVQALLVVRLWSPFQAGFVETLRQRVERESPPTRDPSRPATSGGDRDSRVGDF